MSSTRLRDEKVEGSGKTRDMRGRHPGFFWVETHVLCLNIKDDLFYSSKLFFPKEYVTNLRNTHLNIICDRRRRKLLLFQCATFDPKSVFFETKVCFLRRKFAFWKTEFSFFVNNSSGRSY